MKPTFLQRRKETTCEERGRQGQEVKFTPGARLQCPDGRLQLNATSWTLGSKGTERSHHQGITGGDGVNTWTSTNWTGQETQQKRHTAAKTTTEHRAPQRAPQEHFCLVLHICKFAILNFYFYFTFIYT